MALVPASSQPGQSHRRPGLKALGRAPPVKSCDTSHSVISETDRPQAHPAQKWERRLLHRTSVHLENSMGITSILGHGGHHEGLCLFRTIYCSCAAKATFILVELTESPWIQGPATSGQYLLSSSHMCSDHWL